MADIKIILSAFAALVLTVPAGAAADSVSTSRMSSARLIFMADSLRKEYRFDESSRLYEKAMEAEGDSLKKVDIISRKVLSDNGSMMMGFVSEPVVVARHRFGIGDFFLYYPVEDRSWKNVPNSFDKGGDSSPVKATNFVNGSEDIYYCAPDQTGCRNIYHSERKDSLWSVPALVNEELTSTGNEIYPMLSPDGKSLYFASSGLYGVGGYDLYVSNWNPDTSDWDTPVNLGFPYSSPADDFLYMNTDDGKYTIFASNRFCGADSVDVFVLEFDNMPIRKEISDPAQVQKIAALKPVEDPVRIDNGTEDDIPDNDDTRRYVEKISHVRALKDSISTYEKMLDSRRAEYASSEDDRERERLTMEILRQETLLPQLQDRLSLAVAQLQKIEMDFLFKGVVIDPEKVMAKADREVVGTNAAYTFTKMNPGRMPMVDFEKPKEEFDYSFMVLPTGRFAENSNIPDGIVYQIQMFSVAAPLDEKQIRGLSPVFETRTDNGKYIYRVGVFLKYADALSNLNTVRRLGCKDAFITAFRDGERIDLTVAKELEKTQVRAMYQVNINPSSDELPAEVGKLIREFCDKDVIKVISNGITLFVVAPFQNVKEAEELEALIRDIGVPTVSVTEITQE